MRTTFCLLILFYLAACSKSDGYKDEPHNYNKCLILGNSITVHGLTSYWWGVWGMAASKEENDFLHRFEGKMKRNNPDFKCDGVNIAQWESNLSLKDIDLKSLTQIGYTCQNQISICDYDLIVLRLGENISDDADPVACEKAFKELVESIKLLNPTARIIMTGLFWPFEFKETAIRNVAADERIQYINLDKYCTPSNMESVGNCVYGNDGLQHQIDNKDVAKHPNDSGMESIAEAIYQALQ